MVKETTTKLPVSEGRHLKRQRAQANEKVKFTVNMVDAPPRGSHE